MTRQAHIRIGSRTNLDGTTRADEILEFGTYRGEQFVPKSLLRSEGDGTLEVVTNGNKLALSPNGGNVGVGTSSPNAKLDVAGETIIRGNASVGGEQSDIDAENRLPRNLNGWNSTWSRSNLGSFGVSGSSKASRFKWKRNPSKPVRL